MKIRIACKECDRSVTAELKKGASLTPKDLESMAHFFGFEIVQNSYICETCKEKQKKVTEENDE